MVKVVKSGKKRGKVGKRSEKVGQSREKWRKVRISWKKWGQVGEKWGKFGIREKVGKNGERRPFWKTENHFRSRFSPFQINTQLFF